MTKDKLAIVMDKVISEIIALREAGQKEYAGGEDAFGNFIRLAQSLQISKEKILWVYFMKHVDGINSYINGHISQRESVEGRINDAIVYLIILRGMIEEKKYSSESSTPFLAALTQAYKDSSRSNPNNKDIL